jgi:hypothetical protein
MIVKMVPSKGTGSFSGLADYIRDKEHEGEKVADNYMHMTNCPFGSIEQNIRFIEQHNKLNQRTGADKNMHLIVSFQEDEMIPTKEALQEIEEELLRSIGMEEHYRFSVAHDNTNNFHIHIAVSRICPKTHNRIDPVRSILKLQKKAEEIEEKFSLKRDNHIDKNRRHITGKTRGKDTEIHSGIKNLSTWIKEEVLEDLQAVIKDDKATFEDLQKVLAESNLELKPRGNGMVIAHKSRKLFVKSSSIHRSLSKAQLEKRFGKPLEFKSINTKPKREFGMPKHDLWEQYKTLSDARRAEKSALLVAAKQENIEAKEAIKTKYERLISETKRDLFLTSKAKRNIYKSHFENRRREYQELSKVYKAKRDEIHKKTNQISYKEFLIQKSLEGDSKALAALRKTKVKLQPDEKAILGKTDHKIFITKDPHITKQGLVVYRIGDHGKIIDKGDRLRITIDSNELAIKEMLEMSIAKYGNNLDISGDLAFKQKVLAVTEKYDLKINFKDKTMQEIREAAKRRQKQTKKDMTTKLWTKKSKKGMER